MLKWIAIVFSLHTYFRSQLTRSRGHPRASKPHGDARGQPRPSSRNLVKGRLPLDPFENELMASGPENS
jgi:hypothetical protein